MNDAISRQQVIDAVNCVTVIKGIRSGKSVTAEAVDCAKRIIADNIRQLPPIQPDKDKVSNLLYNIYSIESPHLNMNGVIAKKYYCEELWKELFGKESELPVWMT